MKMDWDKLRIFHSVAEAGSFTRAGDRLNLSQSAVSRQISALEASLGVTLFHRHARGLLLTEKGEMLYRTAREVFSRVGMAEALLKEDQQRPSGPLTITTTVGLGSTWLTPRIHEFVGLYPDIEVTLRLSDSELDLGMREADVAIRLSPPTQAGLVQRHLMTLHIGVYAAPEYIKKHGEPKTAEELDEHALIVFGEVPDQPVQDVNWLLGVGADPAKPRRPVLRINNIYGIFRAVERGVGIAALPTYLAAENDRIKQVLPELKGREFDAYFAYPEEMRHSMRIAVFRDFLLEKVRETKF